MPSLSLDNRLIWFAHCPKAGGTSVEQALVERWGARVGHLHWGWDLWWRQGGWRVADPPNSPQHLVWEDAIKALPKLPDVVFALVRSPHERLASEYRYQRRGRRATLTGRVLAYLPFSFWLRLMLEVSRRNPHAFDNHLRPQADFVPEGAIVFRLEDGLSPLADWFSKLSDTPPLAFGKALATGGRRPIVPALRARIEAAHRTDYTRFGYPTEHPVPPQPDILDRLAHVFAPMVVALDRRGRL